ncbi:MAG: EexN family lipoprotein [Azoarcus sp.]|jgi:hypothetical protein|nr:EexN family lipoprotein [Azoarcus sp.]
MRPIIQSFALVFATGIAFTLSACSEPTRTVEWYKEHEKERKAKLQECANNPSEHMATPNCTNAGLGEIQALTEAMRK